MKGRDVSRLVPAVQKASGEVCLKSPVVFGARPHVLLSCSLIFKVVLMLGKLSHYLCFTPYASVLCCYKHLYDSLMG